ncbi:UNVERIFIED_ORG: hypothetical protein LHJ69_23555 [Shinella sp. XGS7]|nr:hypothetical protein [Shinella sp. XGS7]
MTQRTDKFVGYYLDFAVPMELRVENLPVDFNRTPPQAEARHPDGVNALFFIAYVEDGFLSFMELASTSDWPDDEGRIVFA